MITVLFFAQLQAEAGCSEMQLDNTAGTVENLYQSLQQRFSFSLQKKQLRAAQNHAFCDWQAEVSDGDVIAFIPPVSGG